MKNLLPAPATAKTLSRRAQGGFTLIELLIATAILLVVSAVVLTLMFQMSMTQASINNRTDMHASVRSVTEVMQQEISQAGRVTLPNGYTTLSAATAPGDGSASVASSSGIFTGEWLRIEDNVNANGEDAELVNVTGVSAGSITVNPAISFAHSIGAVVRPVGAFYAGIVPTAAAPASFTNGSSGTVLKLFGDINDDGNMLYEEYTCNPNAGGTGTLTRTSVAYNAVSKAGAAQVLLNNLKTNPVDASTGLPVPCFTYQQQSVLVGATTYYFVLNVAITLTAQTPFKDAQTGVYQSETKALLNISPRNIFEDWQMASLPSGLTNTNVQPVPATVTALLP